MPIDYIDDPYLPMPPLHLTPLDPCAMRPDLEFDGEELLDARGFVDRYGLEGTRLPQSLGQHMRHVVDELGIQSTALGEPRHNAVYPADLWLTALERRGGPFPQFLITVLEVRAEE